MTTAIRRIRVSLGLKPQNYPWLLLRAHAIYTAMMANPVLFPNPTPTMAILLTLLTAFDVAQQATITRAKGTIAARNAKAALLVTALESEETYVQGLCDASPEQAPELIDGAAMFAKAIAQHDKAILEASLILATPGLVQLDANAKMLLAGSRKRPTFNWQSSPDGGKTIVTLPSTPHAKTFVPNMPMLADAWFRASVTLGTTTSEWTQWVKIFVHG